MIKILHTADHHIGLRFNNHPEASDSLAKARFEIVSRIVEMANKNKADIFAVAGDLFDRINMSAADIQHIVQAINRFEGKAALILPGNHDYFTSDSPLWERFKKESADHVIVLDRPEPVDLSSFDLNAMVWPAPCFSKHSSNNNIGWVKNFDKPKDCINIGIAHGSIKGVSPDFDQRFFPMTIQELRGAGVDIWLMGHTHITWPEKPGAKDIVFNPGTPEPDGFDCRHEGRTFLHFIGPDKKIKTDILTTGKYRFDKLNLSLNYNKDVQNLLESFSKEIWKTRVVQLTVSGRLDPEDYEIWKQRRNEIRKSVLELKLDDSLLRSRVTAQQIRKEFAEGSFPEILLSSFNKDEEAELQMAYELIKEVKH